jgi:sugar lactone lactonase YvrE
MLNFPRALVVNGAGDIFIADTSNNRVRVVDHATGIISTIVNASGASGYSGDGGPATTALTNYPQGLALDGSGNLYVADSGNNAVRKVVGGNITAFAGNGIPGFLGDGGPATSAWLQLPRGLAFNSAGDLFIADTFNDRVRKVNHTTGNISTVAGNGITGFAGDGHAAVSAELDTPFMVAFDSQGNLFISDSFNQRIREVNTNGNIWSVVGTCGFTGGFSGDAGPAPIAKVNFPQGIAFDTSNNLFIADIDNNRVREVRAPAGTRGASCPGPRGTPGGRLGVHPSTAPAPGPRIPRASSLLPGLSIPASVKAAHPVLTVRQPAAAAPAAPAAKLPASPATAAAVTPASSNIGIHVRASSASMHPVASISAAAAAAPESKQSGQSLLIAITLLGSIPPLATLWARRRKNRRLNAQSRS